MSALLFSFNAVFPIVIMVVLGYVLKRTGLLSADFFKQLNKLTFKVLLPVTLFVNVYEIESLTNIDMKAPVFAMCGVFVSFLIGFIATFAVGKTEKKGAVWQCAFRSNYAIIGITLSEHILGAEARSVAAILAAFVVPEFNVLAVICLSVFKKDGKKISVKKIIIDICKNPLIHGVLAGVSCLALRMLFAKWGCNFSLRTFGSVDGVSTGFIYKVIKYLAQATTPIALIAMGGQFEFATYKTDIKEVALATLLRCFIVPLIGIFVACYAFGFRGAEVAAFVSVFGSPVAVSSAIMAYEMQSDGKLASALVVSTTLTSIVSLTLIIALLRGLAFI
ncbi:MAG: AEC family transporter [Christensenellaceae bacterium]